MDNKNKKLEKIVRLMQADDSVDAPRDDIKWAKNLFLSRIAEAKPSLARRVIAHLKAEIAPGKAVFGERSASASAVRQMLWEAGDIAVDVRVSPSGKAFEIHGQVLGGEFTGASVRLHGGGKDLETTITELGDFRFAKVPAGKYELIVTRDGGEFVIEDISIG